MARTKLNSNVRKAITKAIEAGVPVTHAASAAGIADRTFRYWRNKGENPQEPGDSIYCRLCQEIEEAEARFIKKNVERVDKAADKDPSHAEWLLERRYPGIFGKRVEIEIGPSKVLLLLQERANKALNGESQEKIESQVMITVEAKELDGNTSSKNKAS